MKTCYVVIEVAKAPELKIVASDVFTNVKIQEAAAYIRSGKAQILFKDCDMSILCDIRKHIRSLRSFTTYFLVEVPEVENKSENQFLIKKAIKALRSSAYRAKILEKGEHYQFISFEIN